MAIQPEFEQEDQWEEFLDKTDPRKRVTKEFSNYSWSFGRDEDDEGFTRDCVIMEVAASKDTEPRQVKAKLTPSHLTLEIAGKEIINDDFVDSRWLDVEDSYWELETKTNKAGERVKNIRYIMYLRSDCPKYITGSLFEKEKQQLPAGQQDDSDDDTADARLRTIANLKEPEPRREADVYFSEEEEFSDYECEGCGSKSVNVMKKADDRQFKVYCNDCPYVSVADMGKEAPSIRRQREVDEARARKKKEKERKQLMEKLAIQDQVPVDLAELEEVD
mmetsp:Transcript_41182/g.106550  ORF Transcript_41182/g.106550 Transcript_41182/m.106550 type:complete len:276 (-) Transcript_41182:18-845(-)